MNTSAREVESALLGRCASAARGGTVVAKDQREANVFRLAAMVVRSRFPRESQGLMQASDRYFSTHPNERLEAVDVLNNGWVLSLPRFRDMLSRRLTTDDTRS